MTSERFKDEVDRLDTGLPEHPDTSAYKREGRAVRRRRQGIVALGAGALVAAAVAPAVLWGGGTTTTGSTGDVASDPSAMASSDPAPLVPLVPVDASYGDDVRAAVAEALPQATFVDQGFGDHYVDAQGGRRPVASTPPDWDNVFTWSQSYAVDDLQYFNATSYWASVPTANMQWCSSASYEIEKDCTVTESNGYTIVVHEGTRLRGEPDGEWTRSVQVISPRSARGRSQYSEVIAQVEGLAWSEAASVLPSIEQLTGIAVDERLRLPEPAEVPSSF